MPLIMVTQFEADSNFLNDYTHTGLSRSSNARIAFKLGGDYRRPSSGLQIWNTKGPPVS